MSRKILNFWGLNFKLISAVTHLNTSKFKHNRWGRGKLETVSFFSLRALVCSGCAHAHTNSVMSYVCSVIPTNFSWNSGTCFPCCRKISNATVLQIFLQHGCTWYKTHEFQRRALQHRYIVKKSAMRMRCKARNLHGNSRNLYLNSSTNLHTRDHKGQD